MVGQVLAELTQNEIDIFNQEFDKIAALQLEDREYIDVFADHREYILESLKIAKNKFEAEFGGLNCKSGQFGWSLIRPDVIRSTSKTSTINHWNVDITATGWTNWIGSSGSEIQVNDEGLFVVLGYMNFSSAPKSVALKHNLMGVEMPINYMEPAMKTGGFAIYELPKPYRLLPKKTFYIRALYNETGRDALAPVGVYFGTGSHLREESPYPESAV